MFESDVPLSAVFGLEDPPKGNIVTPESIARARKAVQESLQDVPSLRLLKNVDADVIQELVAVLRSPLSDIVCTAWNKRKEIGKYADLERYPATDSYYVSLSKHEISQTLKPSIRVLLMGIQLTKLVFAASLTLTLNGSRLVIRGGRITHLQIGEVTADTELRLGKAKLIERDIRQWHLPGQVALGTGIPIPRVMA
jgi:hypothetical protein